MDGQTQNGNHGTMAEQKDSAISILIPHQVVCPTVKNTRSPDGGLLKLKQFAGNMKSNPTNAELLLYRFLKEKNIPFRRQFIISPYIVDFFFAEKKLIIELDGKPHHSANQETYDTKRDELLMSFKILLLRFDNDEILNNPQRIIDIYNKRPTYGTDKLLNHIGYHNNNFKEGGFLGIKARHFKKSFALSLNYELKKIIRRYRFELYNKLTLGTI